MIRRLISLYETERGSGVWYFDFALYRRRNGRLEWTGESEECKITEDDLYKLVKRRLKPREVARG